MDYIQNEVPGFTITVRTLPSGLTEGLQLTVGHPDAAGFRNGCNLLSELTNSVCYNFFSNPSYILHVVL